MRERPRRTEPPQFLSGWKDIANYLGKGVRTVQRYERHLGLPVRRPAGKPSAAVVATRAEIDAWVQASPIREVLRLRDAEPEVTSMTRSISAGISEMMRLRNQMTELRLEVRRSVRSLHHTVQTLQGALNMTAGKETLLLNTDSERGVLEARLFGASAACIKAS
jgi:hypothetical protein